MSCPIRSCRRMGFTLVELLAVVSIIALLIAILLPALNVARRNAKSTATLNTIRVLESGLEAFKANLSVGGSYPESSALPTANPHVPCPSWPPSMMAPSGASLLVWALAGADLLGTPGFRDLDGDSSWRNDTSTFIANPGRPWSGLYAIASNGPVVERHGPFVALENTKCTQPLKNAAGALMGFRIEKYRQYNSVGGEMLFSSPYFLDPFERPILYYRANPVGARIVQKAYADASDPSTTGMYYLEDNMPITGWTDAVLGASAAPRYRGLDLGRGISHPLGFFAQSVAGPGDLILKNQQTAVQTGMGRAILDRSITAVIRPQRSDTYLLLSAGPDGLYGNGDDIGNFNIHK